MPTYLIAMLIYWKIIIFCGDGPLFSFFTKSTDYCENMWENIIFIDNFYEKKCFGWGWYLSSDFQLFLYSLLMIFLYAVNRNLGNKI